jgi:hypothetical protein
VSIDSWGQAVSSHLEEGSQSRGHTPSDGAVSGSPSQAAEAICVKCITVIINQHQPGWSSTNKTDPEAIFIPDRDKFLSGLACNERVFFGMAREFCGPATHSD